MKDFILVYAFVSGACASIGLLNVASGEYGRAAIGLFLAALNGAFAVAAYLKEKKSDA